jgi:hypothetical protein
VELDKANGNTKWQDAEATEKSQLMEYNTFIDHGIELDKANGNTKWQDAEATEKRQLMEYNTFIDHGIGGIAPNGY